MRLPHADEAIVPVEKLRDYVLSRSHPVGRTKAKFFASLGYTEGEWGRLEADIRSQHLQLDAEEAESSKYGMKFVHYRAVDGAFRWDGDLDLDLGGSGR